VTYSLIFEPIAFESGAVGPSHRAFSLPLANEPRSFINAAVWPRVAALPSPLAITPGSLIFSATGPNHRAEAFSNIFNKGAIKGSAIFRVLHLALSVWSICEPVPNVTGTVFAPLHGAITLALAIDHLSFVAVTIRPLKDASSIDSVLAPFPLVMSAIGPSHMPEALAAVSTPLAFISVPIFAEHTAVPMALVA